MDTGQTGKMCILRATVFAITEEWLMLAVYLTVLATLVEQTSYTFASADMTKP